MQLMYSFKVSHLAHFSGDSIRVEFWDVLIAHKKRREELYSGFVTFDLKGIQVTDVKLRATGYNSSFRRSASEGGEYGYFEEGCKEIERLLRLQWKEVVQALCMAKLKTMEEELALAQRKVERILVARDKMRQITGS